MRSLTFMAFLLVTISLGESLYIKHCKVVRVPDDFKLPPVNSQHIKRSANVFNLLMQMLSHQEQNRNDLHNGSENREMVRRVSPKWPISFNYRSKGQKWAKHFQDIENEKPNGMSLLRM